jgi:hypothetical protein
VYKITINPSTGKTNAVESFYFLVFIYNSEGFAVVVVKKFFTSRQKKGRRVLLISSVIISVCGCFCVNLHRHEICGCDTAVAP